MSSYYPSIGPKISVGGRKLKSRKKRVGGIIDKKVKPSKIDSPSTDFYGGLNPIPQNVKLPTKADREVIVVRDIFRRTPVNKAIYSHQDHAFGPSQVVKRGLIRIPPRIVNTQKGVHQSI